MGDFQITTTLKARKQHRCGHCGSIIDVGETYDKTVEVFQGDFLARKSHLECEQAWKWWNWDNDGPQYGDAYSGAELLNCMDWEDEDKPVMLEKFPATYERLWPTKVEGETK